MNQPAIKVRNARVTSTYLGVEDHGILTAWVHLDYGGSGQGFGGYGMDKPIKENGEHKGREGVAWGMEFIRRVLEVTGAESWEKLPGTPVRVRGVHWGSIDAIGHFIDDKWFEPKKDLAHLAAQEKAAAR